MPHTPSTGTRGKVLGTPPPDLVDEMLADYLDWRADAATVWDAYAAWLDAPNCEKPARFSAYTAALEQEEHSAAAYAGAVQNVRRAARP
jgi:hypothetical protein